ncbi:pentatricopeptide repeat-containing protein At3g22690-like [Ananas comosus]|uniref:Pentatricopeptide repeat-containing protein n=2 Tax=Ananas comosus TaxID=4615 RepID=A0A199VMN4_ANACO|nr:pentatricopeptide repeat-containing protein At3g22690-like [Ananas comosus]OAY77980.1 Pentatricopeptide repeat-containing protein [Ananas comosus]CAD1823920.1 unnamed protein product [Ananas comosus var. bracteatus]
MRYLYFQPKPTPKPWTHPHLQKLVSLLDHFSTKPQLLQIHAQMIRTNLASNTFLMSRIIAFLTSPSAESNMVYARRVFDQIPHPNLFLWNSTIRGYTHHGAPDEGLCVYRLMLRRCASPDSYTYAVVASACARLSSFPTGRAVHGMVCKSGFAADMFVASGFVNFYVVCGEIALARDVFDEMPHRDVVSWTSMLSGYAYMNRWEDALCLFNEMKLAGVEPNKVTIVSLLSACRLSRDIDRGRWVLSQIAECGTNFDVDVGNSLISMYAKCGCMSEALKAFKDMPSRCTTTWNALISGFVQNGLHEEALSKFELMLDSNSKPDEITTASALTSCAHLGDLQKGKFLHSYIKDHKIVCDTPLQNALLNMYAKCGELAMAESIFRKMPQRDVFSWTAMICGYVQGNRFTKALDLFEEMKFSNAEANEVTLVTLLSTCSQLGALDKGREIHVYIEENNVTKDACLENALIDMYAKCGCIDVACRIFNNMPNKDIFSWNAMIGGLANHGNGSDAIEVFNKMLKIGDVKPDTVTLTAVLGACAHAGMVREGFYFFETMPKLYGIIPEREHYGCMVDLLSRAGLIDQAQDFIARMPLEANSVMWGSLLAACRLRGKTELGARIAERAIDSVRDDEGAHVLVSNLYAQAGRWDDVKRVRTLMGSKGIEKSPGFSSIEVNGVVHEFLVGDRIIHENEAIFSCLMALHSNLKHMFVKMCDVS